MQQLPVDRSRVRLQISSAHPPEGCLFAMQDEAYSLSTTSVVSPGVFPRSSDPNHVSLGWTEAFDPRAVIEDFGLLPSGSRRVGDQDRDQAVEADAYIELSPYGLRVACPRQQVAPRWVILHTFGDDARVLHHRLLSVARFPAIGHTV